MLSLIQVPIIVTWDCSRGFPGGKQAREVGQVGTSRELCSGTCIFPIKERSHDVCWHKCTSKSMHINEITSIAIKIIVNFAHHLRFSKPVSATTTLSYFALGWMLQCSQISHGKHTRFHRLHKWPNAFLYMSWQQLHPMTPGRFGRDIALVFFKRIWKTDSLSVS